MGKATIQKAPERKVGCSKPNGGKVVVVPVVAVKESVAPATRKAVDAFSVYGGL